jgi:transmembrane sensor
VQQNEDASARRASQRRITVWSIAAVLAVLALGVSLLLTWIKPGDAGDWRDYSASSDQRVVLEDGSALEIRAGSSLTARFSRTQRQVRLMKGGVLFTVQRDAARPFLVNFPAGSLSVIGTRFDVEVRDVRTKVSVIDGTVRVFGGAENGGAVNLAGGEETFVTAGGVEPPRQVFSRSTLAKIAAAFNQRNARPKFIVQGAACARRISASLNVKDPSALIRALKSDLQLSVSEEQGAVVIRERGDTTLTAAGSRSTCNAEATAAP